MFLAWDLQVEDWTNDDEWQGNVSIIYVLLICLNIKIINKQQKGPEICLVVKWVRLIKEL